ncbi:hypothetical protein CFOL_v3_25890 [Cephalotus follicularis]|uniref:Protein BIC1 n=1 Tax=Cephalotus follicularis TaxID=3775 RepID=A0A1Q3CQB2_CEPFO|nr:hypothetical protein CFOL_v3_25890 [Cephalotus follicularis]
MTLQDSFKPAKSMPSTSLEPTKSSEDTHIAPKSQVLSTHQSDNNDTQILARWNDKVTAFQGMPSPSVSDVPKEAMSPQVLQEDCARERLRRHKIEVADHVWIPDTWGQEELLKDWIDCPPFDASLAPSGIMSARAALVKERRATSGGLRLENRGSKRTRTTME